jgi:23S rRNA-/tRNA-specific pseudouridylate synthase
MMMMRVRLRTRSASRHNILPPQHTFSTRLHSATSLLSQRIGAAYEEGQTDGILALNLLQQHARQNNHHHSEQNATIVQQSYSATELWAAIVEFTSATIPSSSTATTTTRRRSGGGQHPPLSLPRSGVAVSILHALIASAPSAQVALDLYQLAFGGDGSENNNNNSFCIQPDVMTFCLLADVLAEHDPNGGGGGAAGRDFLELARRHSDRHIPGSRKERAAAAAAKRRNRHGGRLLFPSFRAAESQLQKWLGQDFAVLFENDSFAIINKPTGISCTAQPNNMNQKGSSSTRRMDLPAALIQTIDPLSTINRALVHRLDQDTSGCLLVPKTNRAHAQFVRQLLLRRLHKTYQCLVVAPGPVADVGTIDRPVDRRPAASTYRILHRYHDTGRALVEMTTRTGRKHQVRVHCAHGLHCPIVGDRLYGRSKDLTANKRNNNNSYADDDDDEDVEPLLHLHASRLSFDTFEGEHVDVHAPRPSFWPA